jgi:cytidylate kinase
MSNNKDFSGIKVAVSGKSGCGNTTVSRILSETLKLRFINITFRTLAEERGLALSEVLALSAKDDSWDIEVDTRQVKLAREGGGCVLGSRLAIWMLPEADFKVFLTAQPETRAKRIQIREGGSIDGIAQFTAARDRQDHERYLRIYNIDNDEYSFADIIIDTDNIEPPEIIKTIIAGIERKLNEN